MKNKAFIPFYGIDRMYKDNSSEISEIIDGIYRGGKMLMGPEIELFETAISDHCDRKYAVAVGSCTDALYFSLKAAGINVGDEVLVTGFSYIASATPILRAGAIPVFVDINSDNFQMNLDDLTSKVTAKTKAIINVNLFGEMLDPEKIIELADSHGLILIEDAAQSLGSEYHGRPSGSVGISSCLSFDPTKIIGAFGNGGAVLCDKLETRDHIRKLRNHGKNNEGEFEILGYNSRMASAQAALLSFQLGKLDSWIARSNEIAKLYNEKLSDIEQIITPKIRSGNIHTFHKYVIRTENRDELKQHLSDIGIQTLVHYGHVIPEQPLFKSTDQNKEQLTVALKTKNEVLSLPIYPQLSNEEAGSICSAIRAFFEK